MELTLTQAQRNVAHAASNDGSRPVLQTVRIGNGKISAADGFILAEAEITKDPQGNGRTILIPAADVLKAKDSRLLGGVALVERESDTILMGADTTVTIPQQGSYPNTDPLYPTSAPVFKITLGYNVLQKILKVCGKDSRIDFTFYGSDQPVKFTNNEVYGIAMPVKKR